MNRDGKRCPQCPRPNCHDCPVEHGDYVWIEISKEKMTRAQWDAITAACPRAPEVKAAWQGSAPLTEAFTRPLIDRTVQLIAATPGFYKLDTSNG